jgi:hypothetical protein
MRTALRPLDNRTDLCWTILLSICVVAVVYLLGGGLSGLGGVTVVSISLLVVYERRRRGAQND